MNFGVVKELSRKMIAQLLGEVIIYLILKEISSVAMQHLTATLLILGVILLDKKKESLRFSSLSGEEGVYVMIKIQ
jgi:hypothetical protein